MAPQNDAGQLRAAWRALAGTGGREGWQTIPVDIEAPCRLLAGRYYPGDTEAMLVGFRSVRLPPDRLLPQGRGFNVSSVAHAALGDDATWIALSRNSEGGQELFAMMAGDVASLLSSLATVDEEAVFHVFLGRIRAWQEFMERGGPRILPPEAEVGLMGELVTLRELVDAGVPPTVALDAWRGPSRGLHDFDFGEGAIEVKTTLADAGFPARVGSLEQLDDALKQPLFCAGIRLAADGPGVTLPEYVEEVRAVLGCTGSPVRGFDTRLIQAGYLTSAAQSYARRFVLRSVEIVPVKGDFPRLTRVGVPVGVLKARYEIDLDAVDHECVSLAEALELLGIGGHGAR